MGILRRSASHLVGHYDLYLLILRRTYANYWSKAIRFRHVTCESFVMSGKLRLQYTSCASAALDRHLWTNYQSVIGCPCYWDGCADCIHNPERGSLNGNPLWIPIPTNLQPRPMSR